MAKITEIHDRLRVKEAELKGIFDEHPDAGEMPDDKATQAKSLGAEIMDLREQAKEIQSREAARGLLDNTPGGRVTKDEQPGTPEQSSKSLRDMIVDSGISSYKTGQPTTGFTLPTDVIDGGGVKTVITLASGLSPQNDRLAAVQPFVREQRRIADLMVNGRTDRTTLEYLEQTGYTNAANFVAEGGTKPESAYAWTLRTEAVRKIAHNVPITDETLADVPGMETIVRGLLISGVQEKEEDALLNGTGVAPQITGLLARAGIQTQAKGTDSSLVAIYKAMTKVRNTGFAEPTAIVMNPTDYQNVRLTQDANGAFMLGLNGGEPPLWGLPVRLTSRLAQGTALVGAFNPFAVIFRREDIRVEASTEHSTFFAENKVLLQAEERLALAVYRAAAFCTVTGLPV